MVSKKLNDRFFSFFEQLVEYCKHLYLHYFIYLFEHVIFFILLDFNLYKNNLNMNFQTMLMKQCLGNIKVSPKFNFQLKLIPFFLLFTQPFGNYICLWSSSAKPKYLLIFNIIKHIDDIGHLFFVGNVNDFRF